MRGRQGVGTKIVRRSGEIVRGAVRTEVLAEGRPWYHLSSRKLLSNQSLVGSGSPAVSTSNTATTDSTTAVSSYRQSHQPYTEVGNSPSGPPSVASSASAASVGSSVSDRIRKLEGNRTRKLAKKRGYGFGGKNSKRGELSSPKGHILYAEWASASVGVGMPKKRSLDNWKDDGRIDDGIGGDERGAIDFVTHSFNHTSSLHFSPLSLATLAQHRRRQPRARRRRGRPVTRPPRSTPPS